MFATISSYEITTYVFYYHKPYVVAYFCVLVYLVIVRPTSFNIHTFHVYFTYL